MHFISDSYQTLVHYKRTHAEKRHYMNIILNLNTIRSVKEIMIYRTKNKDDNFPECSPCMKVFENE